MKLYLKTITVTTIIAFTLIKNANFKLDPDNLGLFAGLALVAFVYKYFRANHKLSLPETDFSSTMQSAIVS